MKSPLPAPFPQVCCKEPPPLWLVRGERRFAVPSKNPTSRAGHGSIRPFRAKARLLWRRGPAAPAHRQLEFQDYSQSLASVRARNFFRHGFPVKLTFLGTRGEIEKRTRCHRMHTSLMVSYRSAKVMIDCGLDWLGKFERLHPTAIVLTHAHPDHAGGLRDGAPCPAYAPQKTWQTLTRCRIEDRRLIKERAPTKICGITFEAFSVEHSILAPAVGYRVSAERAFFMFPISCLFTSALRR